MRVVIDGRVIDDHFPGIGRYVFQLVDALAAVAPPEDAFEVVLEAGARDTRFGAARLARRGNVALRRVDAPVFAPASQWRMRRAIAAARADVFHATYWAGPYWPGVPTVATVYDLITHHAPGGVSRARAALLGLALRLALRGARHVLTISDASRRDIVAAYGLAPERVTATPLAVDGRFRPMDGDAVAALRNRLGLAQRYVLFVGINKPHKNLGTLIDAWGILAAGGIAAAAVADGAVRTPGAGVAAAGGGGAGAAAGEVELVIAGRWDPRYDDLRARAAVLPAGARVRFLGPVADGDLPALYSGAAVFAFPSRYEGFGLPPLEAMACGAPVIAADASSLPEVVGDAGHLVPVDDARAWARALADVLGQPAVAADMRARGLARAATFSWAATARQTLEVYRAAAR